MAEAGAGTTKRRRFTVDSLFVDHRPQAVGVADLAEAKEIRLDRIEADPDQPRRTFDPERLDELADSIRLEGVLQPIVVRYDAGGLADFATAMTGEVFDVLRRHSLLGALMSKDGAAPDAGPEADGGGTCLPTNPDATGPFFEAGAPKRTRIADAAEPGERLFLRGSVVGPDCATPIAGALLASFGDRFHPPGYAWGMRLLGAGLLSLGAWLLSNDLARVAIRKPGLSRYMATSLLLGYLWLAASGSLSLLHGGLTSGELYDAALHAFFLGFVFSMVFAHGPVIFPAILARPLGFHLGFYAPLVVLHAGLAMRVLGDLTGIAPWRPWGGLLNAAAILLFLLAVVLGAARQNRS